MKLPELKSKFKNKYAIRIIAGILVVTLAATGTSVYQVSAAKESTAVEADAGTDGTDEGDETDSLREELLGSVSVDEKDIGKEETVYVIADNAGKEQKIIVSDHLINNDNKTTIEDASTLQDIENVKGDETFTQNGSRIVWQADGNDIYYQGTSTEQLPVSQTITYYLDGKEISPEELAGKSGKVTIRFDYTNHEKVVANIGGKEEEIYVPFVALSGMVLGDSFTNIKVENGRIIADGNKSIVVGYALPGLKESLDVDASDFDGDITIPEYVEITADVENFSLDTTMTVVANATNFMSVESDSDSSSITELLDTLADATDQLEDGSAELADGVDTLKDSLGEFQDGMGSLKDGITAYTQGADALNTGIGSLKSGIDTLASNVPALVSGVGQLKDGADSAAAGAAELATGAAQVSAGVDQLVGTIQSMGTTLEASKESVYSNFQASAGMSYEQAQAVVQSLQEAQENLKTGIGYDAQAAGYYTQAASYYTQAANYIVGGGAATDETYLQLVAGAQQSEAGAQQLEAGAQQYYAGVAQALAASGMSYSITNASEAAAVIDALGDTIAALQNGIGQVDGALAAINQVEASLTGGDSQTQLAALQQGAAQVASGASDLSTGIDALDAGITTLNESAGTLSSGVGQLSDGAAQLANGSSTLVANNGTLLDGIGQLNDGTDAIVDGVDLLSDGAHQLADGVVTFNEDGIQKILNAYNGDMEPLIERIQAVLDLGGEYQTYTDIADGTNGSVKFIYRTDAIKAAD